MHAKTTKMISEVMTPFPHSIGSDILLSVAADKMRSLGVRHLPVRKGGDLIGMLTDRDLKLAASFAGARDLRVEEAMTPDPFTVRPETPVKEVAMKMAEHKYGSALVCEKAGEVIGIFTATDGMRLLSSLLS